MPKGPRFVASSTESPESGSSSEQERVRLLRALFAASASSPRDGVVLGIGDDAALLRPPSGILVWSIDAQVEGVHFVRSWMSLVDIGYRATMAALSDLAAMGARPLGVLAGLVLPLSMTDDELRQLAVGQRDAAEEVGTSVIGGNMARGEELSITTTVLGAAERPLRRDGASPGDGVWLAGDLGRSAAGLALHLAGEAAFAPDEALCDLAFRRPRALIDAGADAAARGASAMIDVSDGLTADLGHLARESDVAVVLERSKLGDRVVESVASRLGRDALALILGGGEDYALVATAPEGVTLDGFRLVGRVGTELSPGVWLDDHGEVRILATSGFDHFAPRGSAT